MAKKKSMVGLYVLAVILVLSGVLGIFFVSQQSVVFVSTVKTVVDAGDVYSLSPETFEYNISVGINNAPRVKSCYDIGDWQRRQNNPICAMENAGVDEFGCPLMNVVSPNSVCASGKEVQGMCYLGNRRWRYKVNKCLYSSYDSAPSENRQVIGGATFFDAGGYCDVNVSIFFKPTGEMISQGFIDKSPIALLLFENGSSVDLNVVDELILPGDMKIYYFYLKTFEENYWSPEDRAVWSQDENPEVERILLDVESFEELNGRGCVGALVEVGRVENDNPPEPSVDELVEDPVVEEVVVEPSVIIPTDISSFVAPVTACTNLQGLFVNDTCFVMTSEVCVLYWNVTFNSSLACEGERVICRGGECVFRTDEPVSNEVVSLPSKQGGFFDRIVLFIKELLSLQ